MTGHSGNVGALDVARYENSPDYELAVVVHRETELERAAASLAFRLEHGDVPVLRNALAGPQPPFDRNKSMPWSEYLSVPVVIRCAEALEISCSVFLTRIVRGFYPGNWEALYWQGEYHHAIEESSLAIVEVEMRLEEQAARFEAQKVANAAEGGNRRHKKYYGEAKAFVVSEWALHRDAYKKNKTKFAKDYARMVKHQFKLDIADSTISDSWLKGK